MKINIKAYKRPPRYAFSSVSISMFTTVAIIWFS